MHFKFNLVLVLRSSVDIPTVETIANKYSTIWATMHHQIVYQIIDFAEISSLVLGRSLITIIQVKAIKKYSFPDPNECL